MNKCKDIINNSKHLEIIIDNNFFNIEKVNYGHKPKIFNNKKCEIYRYPKKRKKNSLIEKIGYDLVFEFRIEDALKYTLKYFKKKLKNYSFKNGLRLINDENFIIFLSMTLNIPREILVVSDYLRMEFFLSDILNLLHVKSISLYPNKNELYVFHYRKEKPFTYIQNSVLEIKSRMFSSMRNPFNRNNFGNVPQQLIHKKNGNEIIKLFISSHGSIKDRTYIKIPKNITVKLAGTPGYSLSDVSGNKSCHLSIYNDFMFEIYHNYDDPLKHMLEHENIDKLFGYYYEKDIRNKRYISKYNKDYEDYNSFKDYFTIEYYYWTSQFRKEFNISNLLRFLITIYGTKYIIELNLVACLPDKTEKFSKVTVSNSKCIPCENNSREMCLYINHDKDEYSILRNKRNHSKFGTVIPFPSYIFNNKENIIKEDEEIYSDKFIILPTTRKKFDSIKNYENCVIDSASGTIVKDYRKNTLSSYLKKYNEKTIKKLVPKWVKECFKNDPYKVIVFDEKDYL